MCHIVDCFNLVINSVDYFPQEGRRCSADENGENSAANHVQTRQRRGTEAGWTRVPLVPQIYLLQLRRDVGQVELCLARRGDADATGQRGQSLREQVQALLPRELHGDNRGLHRVLYHGRPGTVQDDRRVRLSGHRAVRLLRAGRMGSQGCRRWQGVRRCGFDRGRMGGLLRQDHGTCGNIRDPAQVREN